MRETDVNFTHVTNWTDASQRLAVAEMLAVRTGHNRDALTGELDRMEQALAENLTSNHIVEPLEVSLGREVNAADLQAQGSDFKLRYMPLLGRDGFIMEGASNLIASYPKAGKTELMTTVVHAWGALDVAVLYFTEEPRQVWQARLGRRPAGWEHVTLILALGMGRDALLERIRKAQERAIVIDTVRNLLGLQDEKDNSEVARALLPFIEAARAGGKTIIFLHHDRKGGGEHGEGIAGGHAFLGVVDIAVELRRDPQSPRRRLLKGWGRIAEVPELVYEMTEAGEFKPLGNPAALALDAVKDRLENVLTEEWATTKEVHASLGDPQPSMEQGRMALISLAEDEKAERDPAMSDGQQPGKTYRWRATNLTSNGKGNRLEVRSSLTVRADLGEQGEEEEEVERRW